MGELALALLALAALHGAGASEPLENDSEPGKSGAAGKPWKAAPSLADLDLDTAGRGAEWTSWFNIDHPGGDGDYESLEAIRFYYRGRVCERPVAIQARTTEWELPEDVGEVVHVSPKKGFCCINKEQPQGKTCSNYHIRFLCPLEHIYWSHWSSWSPCSRSACGSSGTQTRTRRCVNARLVAALKEVKCKGKAVERRPCSAGPCPEPAWMEWGTWGPCSRSCGSAGTRVRRRSCKKAKKVPCAGRPTEVQKCPPSPCPACPERTLQGTVVSATGAALPDARIYLEGRPPVLLARSDADGRFAAAGLCEGTAANVSAHREGFAPGLAPIVSNGSGVAVANVTLRRLEKPYMVLHPKAKVRVAGQEVTFCCKASGTPVPKKYYWYHNGTLLERKVHRYGSQLVLRGLAPEQAGTYHCKASTEAGAIKSAPAQLTVLAQGQQSCKPEPEPSLVELPSECPQDAAGSRYYNVGRCAPTLCAGGPADRSACGADTGRCCGVRRMEMREIPCAGFVLPVKVVAECGCGPCTQPRILVQGRVTAADTGEPLRFGQIFLGGRKVGFTGYKGSFTIEVPPDTQRLVVRFVDRQQRLVDAVKVLPFNRRGGAVYQEVKMLRKKEPVDLDGSRSNAIPLGEASGQEPIGELVLPAGVFLRPSGEVFRGTVKASVTFLDPRDMATASAASSDLSFANAEGEIVPLRTYGMFAVDFLEGESGAALQTGPVEVRMDAGQVRMPEHLQKMKLWSLNPETGLWEEEGVLRPAGGSRGKREERTFLVGNLEIRERRLFNLDVPEDRRCFVKVRAYSNEKFNPYEQLEGVVISLINLEPQPGYPANPRAWGRFDSVVTGPNGACLPAFCDGQRPDAYSAYVTATLGGEELEAVASSPKLNPNAIGVSQPYLGKLGYRRLDHDDPDLKKTAFQINVAKPDPNNVDETNGPIYPYRSLEECEEAPVSANHLRFYRVEVDKYEYNVVPFKESDLTSWTGDYLSWWPNPQEFRACFIKVQIEGPQEYMVRSRNVGGSHPRTRGQLYGLRDTRSVRDTLLENTSGACVEFKCSGMLFDQSLVDRTLVSIVPQGSCHRTAVNSLLRDYLSRHPPVADNNHTAAFTMLAPVDPLGHNYGIYTVTDQNPRLAKEIAIGRCFDGTSDGFSREMKADAGTAVTFTCQERPPGRESFFQRLLTAPAEVLAEIRREMGAGEMRRAPPEVMDFASGARAPGPTATRRTPSSRRRMGRIRGQP
ncbi:LOW QUALITY PROTEIN: cartilage intermediate layer protein 2 [Harpia harpyja]|uniref:LOW QUALITY PROTEIN: cartilage intermediate layer protein 2 n=1 Tax=Harpia harpyja TaxID=202280 RepID=UPI0022B0DEC8|nr:LOW QUALITY PROTEIN: cartilage intermediate layer protein 2 [Harpia harpyja]